jgi:hypothetical protein
MEIKDLKVGDLLLIRDIVYTNSLDLWKVTHIEQTYFRKYVTAQLINTTGKGSLRASTIKNKHEHEIGAAFAENKDYIITKITNLDVVNTPYFGGSDD